MEATAAIDSWLQTPFTAGYSEFKVCFFAHLSLCRCNTYRLRMTIVMVSHENLGWSSPCSKQQQHRRCHLLYMLHNMCNVSCMLQHTASWALLVAAVMRVIPSRAAGSKQVQSATYFFNPRPVLLRQPTPGVGQAHNCCQVAQMLFQSRAGMLAAASPSHGRAVLLAHLAFTGVSESLHDRDPSHAERQQR